MKLNQNDKIYYDGRVYQVVAVIWSTVYLSAIDDENTYEYEYTMDEVYKSYKDIEFLQERG